MRALLFAAGRGERMRPLSDATAKPLLRAGGRHLIEWQIEALVRAGIDEIVINTAHLASQIEAALGDGRRYGARIQYSREGEVAAAALETRGGIVKALPLLGIGPFVATSSDIVTDFDYARLVTPLAAIRRGEVDAHLVLVDNPAYHPQGDMGLADGLICHRPPLYTYANIALFSPAMFDGLTAERAALYPWLYDFVERGRVGGEHFRGRWHNVGTPEDLARLDAELVAAAPQPPGER